MNYVHRSIELHIAELEKSKNQLSNEVNSIDTTRQTFLLIISQIERLECLMKSAKKEHWIDRNRLEDLKKDYILIEEKLEMLRFQLEDEVGTFRRRTCTLMISDLRTMLFVLPLDRKTQRIRAQ